MRPVTPWIRNQDGTAGESSDDVFTTSADVITTGAEYHFDFGQGGSPVADGYEQVTAGTDYHSALGYGWLSGLESHKYENSGDPLTDDFVLTADSTFAVDVASGTYDVTVTMGRSSRAHDQMGVLHRGHPDRHSRQQCR